MLSVKQRILEAAKQLYVDHGYAGLSMRKVAKLAGVSPMASYRHYDNKDQLLHELQVYAFSVYSSKYLTPLLEYEDAWAAVRASLSAYADFAEQDTAYFKIAFMTTDELKGLKTLTEEGEVIIERSFRLALGIVARAVGDADAKIETLRSWCFSHGLISLHLSGRLRFLGPEFRPFYEAEMDHHYAELRRRWEPRPAGRPDCSA